MKYRHPTVLENMKLLKEAKEFFGSNDPIGAKIAIMEKIELLLDFSEMEGIKNFEELNQHGEEMTLPISEIADDILNKLVSAFAKKN